MPLRAEEFFHHERDRTLPLAWIIDYVAYNAKHEGQCCFDSYVGLRYPRAQVQSL